MAGAWMKKMDCPSVCRAGACLGSCAPGSKRCGANQTPDHCSDAGEWVAQTVCMFACTGAGNCTGDCKPTTKDCLGKQPRLCDGNGTWQGQASCQYACRGTGACTTCDPGVTRTCTSDKTRLQQCKSDGTGFEDFLPCPNGCNSTRLECNSCKPGGTKCDQAALSTCNTDGNAYTLTSSCDKACGWGMCPSSGGPCFPMKDTYVVPDARKVPGYQFCEIHDLATAYQPPLVGACDYPGGGPVYVYVKSGDSFWVPKDDKYYICAGQVVPQWRELTVGN
jgi:hypothetical protein